MLSLHVFPANIITQIIIINMYTQVYMFVSCILFSTSHVQNIYSNMHFEYKLETSVFIVSHTTDMDVRQSPVCTYNWNQSVATNEYNSLKNQYCIQCTAYPLTAYPYIEHRNVLTRDK